MITLVVGGVGGGGWITHGAQQWESAGEAAEMSQALVPSGSPTTPGVRHKAVPELEARCGESGGGVGLRHGGGGGGQGGWCGEVGGGRAGWVKTGTTGDDSDSVP